MGKVSNHLYEFGPFRLDQRNGLLLRGDEVVPLTPKAFDTLLLLVQNSGRVLSRDELMSSLWPDTVVEENNLTQNISMLRKALGEGANGLRFIETVPKRGYRFIESVRESSEIEEIIIEGQASSRILVEEVSEASDQQELAHLTGVKTVSSTWRLRRATPIITALMMVLFISAWYLWKSSNADSYGTDYRIKSIAILPFRMINADSDSEFLGLGTAETLRARLNNIKEIIVLSEEAVNKHYAPEIDPVLVGKELKVDSVLDGSIQVAGDKLRITLKLTRPADGASLWAKKFDGKLTEIFPMQDQISEQLAAALSLKLNSSQREMLTKRYTESAEAYQFYLKGRDLWNRRLPWDVKQGINFFQKAIELDPNYALPYAGLADSYSVLGGSGQYGENAKEQFTKAKEAALKALEMDNSLAEVHTSLAIIYLQYDWDWPNAETRFRRAIDLNPQSSEAHYWYSYYLYAMGRMDEALAESRLAFELEPIALMNGNVARALLFARRYDEAIEECYKTLELDSNSALAYSVLGSAYEQQRNYNKAIEVFQKLVAVTHDNPSSLALLGHCYAVAGNKQGAMEILERLQKGYMKDSGTAYLFAILYIGLRQNDQSFMWLNKAYNEHLDALVYLKVDPLVDGIRNDPRFAELLDRMRLN